MSGKRNSNKKQQYETAIRNSNTKAHRNKSSDAGGIPSEAIKACSEIEVK